MPDRCYKDWYFEIDRNKGDCNLLLKVVAEMIDNTDVIMEGVSEKRWWSGSLLDILYDEIFENAIFEEQAKTQTASQVGHKP